MLRLSFLGRFSVELAEEPIQAFESDKVRGLLAYLAMEKDQQHRRDSLTGLFWPEMPEATARHNLSQGLYSLRSQIKLTPNESPFVINSQSIGFYLNQNTWVDAHSFSSITRACASHQHDSPLTCQQCLEDLKDAAALYRGDFLTGLALNGCERFEDWLFLQREVLRSNMLRVLERLSFCLDQLEDLERAAGYARQWVSLDPLNETGHRQLIQLLARQGLRSEALAQYNACREVLLQELGVEPEASTTELMQGIRQGLPSQRAKTHLHNLPTFLTPLIGRQEELNQISDRLNDPNCRLLTLVGPGGIGKTRLAVDAAWKQFSSFPDGEFMVELQIQGTDSSLLLAISNAANLGLLSEPETPRPSISRGLKEQVLDHLHQKQLLLILDGFERYINEATSLGELLRYAPKVKVLVTSRTRLNLEGEQVFPVEGLSYPNPLDQVSDISTYEAVQIFIDAARRIHPNYRPEPRHFKAIVDICSIMQGIPLGILLAASWIGMMEPAQIAAEIQRNLDFLSSDWHDLPERHRSLRATFAYSLGLLSTDLQTHLLSLSIFTTSFTPLRAQQVTGTSLPQLRILTDHSLVIQTKGGRYQLHGILRQYAREGLINSPEIERKTREKYCRTYMQALATWARRLMNHEQLEALAEMDRDLPDIQAAWAWAIGKEQLTLLVDGAEGLGRYFFLRNQFDEGLSAFSKIFASIPADNLFTQNPLLWARTQKLRGIFYLMLKDFTHARLAFLDIDQRLQRESSLVPELALERAATLSKISDLLLQTGGDRLQALAFAEEALAINRQFKNPWKISLALLQVAVCQYRLGNIRLMLRYAEEAMAIQNEVGDPELTHSIDTTFGFAAMLAGQFESALQSVQRQSAYLLREATRRNQADVHGQLSLVFMNAGRYQEAQEHVDQALSLYIPPDEVVYIEYYALIRGSLNLYTGQYDAVHSDLAVHGDTTVDFVKPQWLLAQGFLHLLVSEYGQAEVALLDYIRYHESIQRPDQVGQALALLSYCAYCQGNLVTSRHYLIASLENYLTQGFIMVLIFSLYQVALVLAESDHLEAAAQLYASLKKLFIEQNILLEDLYGRRIQQRLTALPVESLAKIQVQAQASGLEDIARDYLAKLKNMDNLFNSFEPKDSHPTV